MSDDLIARLRFHRHDLCVEAAAALEAKGAEIAGLHESILRMGRQFAVKNTAIIAGMREIAALKARLAAAEGVAEASRGWGPTGTWKTKLAAYDALRAAQGEKQG